MLIKLFIFTWQENESLNNREVPLPSKISKVEPAPVDSVTSNIKTASSHNRNGSYPEPGVEASTSTRSLQVLIYILILIFCEELKLTEA